MARRKNILIIWLSLFCVGCEAVKSAASHHERPPAPAAAYARQADTEIPSDMIITLERTACFGRCPNYKITIHADGTVIYEGKRHVKKTGEARGRLTREQVKELVSEVEKIGYFSLRDSYSDFEDGCHMVSTDSPWFNTSVQMNGKAKTVKHDSGCVDKDQKSVYPPALTAFEKKIDEVVNSRQWVGERN
jgi:Domain of unknown function (DUF6438)